MLDLGLFTCDSVLLKIYMLEASKWITRETHMRDIRVLMRAAKVWYTAHELRCHITPSANPSVVEPRSLTATPTPRNSATLPRNDDERAKHKLLALQSAELYADMAAEYMVIGCSASIMYFYGSHPKYNLVVASGASSSVRSQGESLPIQLGVGLVVDFVACVMEIRSGVDFQELLAYKTYLSLFFANLAVTSILISSVMYMSV